MLKSQDCFILLKLVANPGQKWSQRELSKCLGISLAEIHSGIKRLLAVRLLRKDKDNSLHPIMASVEEYLIHAVKYQFPGKIGEYTRGTPTAIAAPIFKNIIALGHDPIPVWPYALGQSKGVALEPIHSSMPEYLDKYPDIKLYELLALVDTIRSGGARERNLAIDILIKRLNIND